MVTEFDIYIMTRCDYLSNFFLIAMIFSALCFVLLSIIGFTFSSIYRFEEYNDKICKKKEEMIERFLSRITKTRNLSFVLLILFSIGIVATPTTKEMAFIKVVPMIANSDFVSKELPNEVREIYVMAKDYLKKSMENNDGNTDTRTGKQNIEE